jgi:hypothetical protein
MISKDKTYRTRDGREVRIYATDAGGLFPVHGAILCDDLWIGMKWTEEGKTHFFNPSCMVSTVDDLAEVKPRIQRTVWLNVYPDKNGDYSQLRNLADALATTDRLACVKVEIDCEEGEGL